MLELAPVLVAVGALLLLERFVLTALEREDRAGQVGEGLQVADGLELVARQHGREAQLLRGVRRRGARDQLVDGAPHLLEGLAPAVDAGNPAGDQQPGFEQFAE